MPHSRTAILRACSRVRMSVSAARVTLGSMPRSASLAPSSRITASVPSGTDQSSRSRPPEVVSPDTPALIMSTSIPLAFKAFCSRAGNAAESERPRPALKESPSTTILIGFAACADAGLRHQQPAADQRQHEHVHDHPQRPLDRRKAKCHMNFAWTVSSNPRHWQALFVKLAAGHHFHLQRQSLARQRVPRGFISSRISACGWRPAKRSG